MIDSNVFNINKTDYTVSPLFLGDKPGLFDTVNKQYPKLWDLYKKMKSLDWDENEFDFTPCLTEFKTCPKSVYDMMIKTLAWQWEADSVAAHNLVSVTAPFISSNELFATWSRIGDNECLHSAAYSEIVRNSFDNPDEILSSILAEAKALQRLSSVSAVFAKTYDVSHRLALGQVARDSDEAYDAIFMLVVALLALERIQFMASFAITFAIADTGMFLPIGKSVQKICTDELQVHVEVNKFILRNELGTVRGKEAFARNLDAIKTLIKDVTNSELIWTDYMFTEGRELVGLNSEVIKDWVLFGTNDVYNFLGIQSEFKVVNKNPLGYMNDWIDINHNQASPQEEKVGNYLLGGLKDTAGDAVFELDF